MADSYGDRLAAYAAEYGAEKCVGWIEGHLKQLVRNRQPEVRQKQLARAKEQRIAKNAETETLRRELEALRAQVQAAQQ